MYQYVQRNWNHAWTLLSADIYQLGTATWDVRKRVTGLSPRVLATDVVTLCLIRLKRTVRGVEVLYLRPPCLRTISTMSTSVKCFFHFNPRQDPRFKMTFWQTIHPTSCGVGCLSLSSGHTFCAAPHPTIAHDCCRGREGGENTRNYYILPLPKTRNSPFSFCFNTSQKVWQWRQHTHTNMNSNSPSTFRDVVHQKSKPDATLLPTRSPSAVFKRLRKAYGSLVKENPFNAARTKWLCLMSFVFHPLQSFIGAQNGLRSFQTFSVKGRQKRCKIYIYRHPRAKGARTLGMSKNDEKCTERDFNLFCLLISCGSVAATGERSIPFRALHGRFCREPCKPTMGSVSKRCTHTHTKKTQHKHRSLCPPRWLEIERKKEGK